MTDQIDSNVWEDLVVSILSVNQYTLSNTYKSLVSLRKTGIFDPENLASWDSGKIEQVLKQGGCDRGTFMTGLFAERLDALGNLLAIKGIQESELIILCENRKEVEGFLISVKGIGPKVLKNFFALRKVD